MAENTTTLSDEAYFINAFVIAVLFIIGVAGQTVSLMVLLGKVHRQRDFTPYFVNIAVANSLMLVLNFPVIFASSVKQRYVLNQTGCNFFGFNAGTTGIVMITTLTCVTVAIYRKVTRKNTNTNPNKIMSSWRRVIAGTWFYSIALMLPPLFGWNSTVVQSSKTSCAPNWKAKSAKDIAYLVLLSVCAFLIPLTVSLVYFIKLYRYIESNQRTNQALSIQQRRAYEHYKMGARMIAIATLMFFLVWAPYCAFALASTVSQGLVIEGDVAIVPGLMAKTSVIYSPIIYAIVNRRFRNTLVSLLPASLRRFTQVEPHGARSAGLDLRSGKVLVPRSPLTSRSRKTSFQLPTTPHPLRPRAQSLSPRSSGSIRLLIWPPSFLALKILRAHTFDESTGCNSSGFGRHQPHDDQKSTGKDKEAAHVNYGML